MALVSESTRSTFPTRVDSFTSYTDSQERKSVLDANIFNKILSAIYQLEVYSQGVPRIVEAGGEGESRTVFKINKYFSVNGTKNVVTVPIPVPAALHSLVAKEWHRLGNSVEVTVRRTAGTDTGNRAFRGWVEPVSDTMFNVIVDHIDPSGKVEEGDYLITLVIIGR